MKKLINIWFWFFLYLAANGQSAQYFNKTYTSFAGSSSISTVVQTDSNYLLVIDNLATPQPQNTIFILADKSGNIIDSIQYPGAYKYSFVYPGATALKSESGNFVIATNRNDTNNFLNPHLFCLDTNLDTLWTRKYTHPDTLAVLPGAYCVNVQTAIRQTWDGGFIITGNYSKDCDQNQMRSYLLKTDSMGVMEWIKKYNSQSNVYSLVITSDSGYAFTDFSGGFHLNITDQIGEVLIRNKPNNETHLISGAVGVLSNGDLAIMAPYVYAHPMPNLFLYGINTVRYDKTGQKIWDKKYLPFRSFRCHSLHQAFTMQILPDDHIVIGGTSTVYDPMLSPGSEYKGVMMKLSPNGDSLWARYYGYGPFNHGCQFEHMIPTADAGFLAVGYYYPLAPSRPWLVKMDSLGCDTPGCHLISIEERVLSREEPEVFPNPFRDLINIVLPEGFLGGKLVMYDVQGRRAVEVEVPASYAQQRFTMQTGHLKPGMYLVELTGQNERVWRRKVVKSN